MRAYRRRPWLDVTVDLTPLIDVVFLIIIFFIILINFADINVRDIALPNADAAQSSKAENKFRIPITVNAESEVFYFNTKIALLTLPDYLERLPTEPEDVTAVIRADKDIPYELVQQIMQTLADRNIDKVEFASWPEAPESLQDRSDNES